MTPPEWVIALASTAFGLTAFWLALWGFVAILVFLFMFRAPIAEFIRRMRRVGGGKWGAEAQELPAEQKASPSIAETLAKQPDTKGDPRHVADELISKLSRTDYVINQEEVLRKALSDRGLEPGSPETYRVLTAFTASSFVAGDFEQLYNILWTSQLQILNDANPKAPMGLTVDELRVYYDWGATITPAAYNQYSFEAYLAFLVDQHLILPAGPSRYSITVKGRAFLAYLVEKGKALTGRVY